MTEPSAQEKIAQRFRVNRFACPICQERAWLVGQTPLAIMERKGILSRKGIPIIAVTCKGCGYVAIFKENKLG